MGPHNLWFYKKNPPEGVISLSDPSPPSLFIPLASWSRICPYARNRSFSSALLLLDVLSCTITWSLVFHPSLEFTQIFFFQLRAIAHLCGGHPPLSSFFPPFLKRSHTFPLSLSRSSGCLHYCPLLLNCSASSESTPLDLHSVHPGSVLHTPSCSSPPRDRFSFF